MSMSDKIRRNFENCYFRSIIPIHGIKINTTGLIMDYFLLPI